MPLDSEPIPDTPVIKLVRRLEDDWYNFRKERDKYGANELAWAEHSKETLEKMRTQIEGWIQECKDELAARPSPVGTNNGADYWKDALTFQLGRIQKAIDDKNEKNK